MEDIENELTENEIRSLIEEELRVLITCAIELEYDFDKMDNLIYRDGGKQRATDKMRILVQEWEKEYNISQEEIIKILKRVFRKIDPANKAEGNEIIGILGEIEEEQRTNKDKTKVDNTTKEIDTREEK